MDSLIIEFLVKEKVINTKDIELYQYGLFLLIKKVIHSLIILLIGLVSGEFLGIVIFLVSYIKIREYSGGYHAKTIRGCYLCTAFITIISIVFIKILPGPNRILIWIFLFISGSVIWFFSPQEAVNKPLKINELYEYRKITRRYLTFFCGFALIGFVCPVIIKGIVCAWIIQAIMLLIGGSMKKHITN